MVWIIKPNPKRRPMEYINRNRRWGIRHWCPKGNRHRRQLLLRDGRYLTRCHHWCQPHLQMQSLQQQPTTTTTTMFSPSSIGNFLIEKFSKEFYRVLLSDVWLRFVTSLSVGLIFLFYSFVYLLILVIRTIPFVTKFNKWVSLYTHLSIQQYGLLFSTYIHSTVLIIYNSNECLQ